MKVIHLDARRFSIRKAKLAESAYIDRDLLKAEMLWLESIKYEPNADAYYGLGLIAYIKRDWGHLADMMRKVIEGWPVASVACERLMRQAFINGASSAYLQQVYEMSFDAMSGMPASDRSTVS